jgi:hypothetical protein
MNHHAGAAGEKMARELRWRGGLHTGIIPLTTTKAKYGEMIEVGGSVQILCRAFSAMRLYGS